MSQFWIALLVGAVIIGVIAYFLRGEEVPPVCEAVYIADGVVQNWFGNRRWKPSQIRTPASLEELLQIVRDVYRRNQDGEKVTMRMVGALHSWSGCAECEGGIMLRSDKLNKILSVDEENRIIKVEAGIQLGDFYKELKRRKWAMASLPNTPHLTLGGTISNAAHGTNKDYGTICSFVAEMQLVVASGEVLTLRPGAPEGSREKHLFEAAIVSWGCLGIIYSVSMRVVPEFNTLVHRAPLDYSLVHGRIEHLMKDNQSLLLGINPRSKTTFIKTQTPVPKSTTEISPPSDLWDFIVEARVFSIFYGNYRKKPWKYLLGQFLNRFASSHLKLLRVMNWDDGEFIVKAWKDRAFLNIEYVCPIDKIDAAVAAITEVFDDARAKNIHDHNTPFFLRNVRADKEGYLSSSKGYGLVSTIDIPYQKMDAGEINTFREFEKRLIALGCRLSFSRKFNADPADVLKAYPEYPKFVEAVKELDPYNMFSNEMRRDFFGL